MIVNVETLPLFKERFYGFYDGVVCGVELVLRSGEPVCSVCIECQDRDSASGWSDLVLEVRGVSEFRFQENAKAGFRVLTGGIQFVWRESNVYVVLDAYPDDGLGLPDLTKNSAYIVGLECEWRCVSVGDGLMS